MHFLVRGFILLAIFLVCSVFNVVLLYIASLQEKIRLTASSTMNMLLSVWEFDGVGNTQKII